MKKAEDILDDFKAQVWAMKREDVIKVMEEYGRLMWNAALEWAAENANCRGVRKSADGYLEGGGLNKESILKGKI